MSGQNCPGCGKAQPPAYQGAVCACGSTAPALGPAVHGGSLPPTRPTGPSATPAPPPSARNRGPVPHHADDRPTLNLPVVPAQDAVANATGGTEAGQGAGATPSGEDFALRVRPYVTLPGSEERVLAQPLPPVAEPVVVTAEEEPGPRRRRTLPLIAAAAGGVVVLSLVVAGLLPEGAADDRAKPGPTYEEGTFRPPPKPSPSPTSASPSAKPGKSARPASSAPAPPVAPEPTRSEPPREPAAAVLRPGDRGPEVAELQRRLKQAFAYAARDNGVYTKGVESGVRFYQLTHGIEGDEPGVYGPATRKSLEAGTTG